MEGPNVLCVGGVLFPLSSLALTARSSSGLAQYVTAVASQPLLARSTQ